ncbi:hypothetical protein DFH09DRAFT_1076614 [Mycena vulgaris]|nr:hypothetical protein DFH09DRAFT_1076614 [Mycena vulgaris]
MVNRSITDGRKKRETCLGFPLLKYCHGFKYSDRSMSGARQYRVIPEAITAPPSPEPINSGIRISTSDGALFTKLEGRLSAIVVAVKSLGTRKKGAGKGKQKAAAQNLNSDGEESDFPEAVSVLPPRHE